MSPVTHLLVFRLDSHRYALPLEVVDRIVRAAEITPLPNAPPAVLGLLDIGGRILPVFNLRARFALPERDLQVTDHFLVATIPTRTVVLPIDFAEGVAALSPHEIVTGESLVPGLPHVHGVVKMRDGLVFIHDLSRFLSMEESAALDEALREDSAHAL